MNRGATDSHRTFYCTAYESQPGTYALILQSTINQYLGIGQLGELQVCPGIYIYIGSAFGPGGLLSRVSRHQRLSRIVIGILTICAPSLDLNAFGTAINPSGKSISGPPSPASYPGP